MSTPHKFVPSTINYSYRFQFFHCFPLLFALYNIKNFSCYQSCFFFLHAFYSPAAGLFLQSDPVALKHDCLLASKFFLFLRALLRARLYGSHDIFYFFPVAFLSFYFLLPLCLSRYGFCIKSMHFNRCRMQSVDLDEILKKGLSSLSLFFFFPFVILT